MSDHGGIRFVYPVHPTPGAPITLNVVYADGHCERYDAPDEKLFHIAAELMVMLRDNMQARGR